MKKNTMMRLASVLLIVTLLTTSVISGTFAKYTTTSQGQDQARVAYWGFGDETLDFELFDTGDSGILGNGLLAPGSGKSMAINFAYTNHAADPAITAPEVAYTFSIVLEATGDVSVLNGNPNFYWTLGTVGYKTFADLKTAVEALARTDGSNKYAPGTLPENFDSGESYNIGWQWFFGDTQDTGLTTADGTTPILASLANDDEDTAMGNAVDLADVNFSITITATQDTTYTAP